MQQKEVLIIVGIVIVAILFMNVPKGDSDISGQYYALAPKCDCDPGSFNINSKVHEIGGGICVICVEGGCKVSQMSIDSLRSPSSRLVYNMLRPGKPVTVKGIETLVRCAPYVARHTFD